jgi:DUF2075 family protein
MDSSCFPLTKTPLFSLNDIALNIYINSQFLLIERSVHGLCIKASFQENLFFRRRLLSEKTKLNEPRIPAQDNEFVMLLTT